MSGFCGVVDFTGAPAEPEVLQRMAAVSRGLGPDGIIPRHAGGAAFCHLALHATPQASTERQPLRSADGAVWLVADIRLDNRDDLISQLAGEDLPSGDPGDATLLLAAYLRWGVACPEHLLGDFAFVIWDERERRVLCARDPLGIGLLHYARIGPLLCFASEAQQILQHPRVPLRLDEMTIADYLSETWDGPTRTFFQDVQQVPAAHRLICNSSGDRLERYWEIDPERRIVYGEARDYAAHFLEVFAKAVADRMRAPAGPVAIAMSGGLDSTSVAAVARRHAPPGTGPDLFTCSFIFNTLKECDERDYIRTMAETLDVESELVDAERFWILGDAETCRPRLETPFLSWESSFREMLRRAQSRKARVLLTGHGGDDLLAGSLFVYADRLLSGDLRVLLETGCHAIKQGMGGGRTLYRYFGETLLPRSADRKLRRLLGRAAPVDEIPEWIRRDFVERTGMRERLSSNYVPARHPRGAAWMELYDQITHIPVWCKATQWYYANASPFGIEARHPFLDRRVAEFLLAIPARQRSQPGCYKPLLRRAMQGVLPDRVRLRADKTVLESYLDIGLRERRREKIEQLLADSLAAELGILDGAELRAAYQAYQQGTSKHIGWLWHAITLEMWLRGIAESEMEFQDLPVAAALSTDQ
jgi:asparagine synthase (glutamine-hydrolysing)